MGKWKQSGVKQIAQGTSGSKSETWDLNPRLNQKSVPLSLHTNALN